MGGVLGGDLEPLRFAAGDADGRAVQVVADDAHLAPNDFGIERLASRGAGADEAGVEVDALAAHAKRARRK